jgi:protein O-GlcNAc transferase
MHALGCIAAWSASSHATGALDAIDARVVEYPRSLFDARSAIAAEQCDVLFYPEIGMDELTYYLGFARLAPVQCVSWEHPVTTGIPAIDYSISARDLEAGDADSHYSEGLVRLAGPPTCYSRPLRPAAPLVRASLGVPIDATLYLCPQSLFKFHPDFDVALAAILREDARGRIVMLVGNHPHWMNLLKARFRRNIPDAAERILFVPPLMQSEFFSLLLTADVMLDPFYFGGGNSTYEALALGVPIVTTPGAFMRGRITYACYKRMGFAELIANDVDSYPRIAVRIANDRAWRESVSAEIQKRSDVLFEDTGAIKELGDFLFRACRAAGANVTGEETESPFEADRNCA